VPSLPGLGPFPLSFPRTDVRANEFRRYATEAQKGIYPAVRNHIAWLSGHKSRGGFECRWDSFCGALFLAGSALWRSLMLGAIAIVPGLLIRALASGHVRKNEALATSGPYAYTRNPLYLGSLVMGVGFCVAARSWWVGVVACGDVLWYLSSCDSR